MDNESIPSESEFYLHPEEQNKYGLFVFFHSMCDIYITWSINFSYTAKRRPAFFMNWKFLLVLKGKNKYVIHRLGSVRIGKNCALCLENVFKAQGTVFFYLDLAAGK